jgi:hypothetical protein
VIGVIDANVWISALQFAKRRGTPTLEHFHFYAEQDRAAKCGFTSTPASFLPGTPVLEEKPRWVRSLCKHQK